jgi:hypothetical protein
MVSFLRSTSGWVVNNKLIQRIQAAGWSEGPAPAAEAQPDLAG